MNVTARESEFTLNQMKIQLTIHNCILFVRCIKNMKVLSWLNDEVAFGIDCHEQVQVLNALW